MADGSLVPGPDDEDVHAVLEGALLQEAGAELGGRLRAGRSRNDQIATLIRLYLRDHVRVIGLQLVDLIDALAAQADATFGAILPGRTHLQHAQPVLLAHHLLAHAWPLVRDLGRLGDWAPPCRRVALRVRRARRLEPRPRRRARRGRLGFSRTVENSIDGTAARDVVAEFAFVAAMIGVDLSRLAEDVILWSTRDVGLRAPARLLVDGVVDHAAEEEPRHRRARARQGRQARRRPHRPAHHAEGAPARVQPGSAGGQGAGVRPGRRRWRRCCRRSPAWSPRSRFDTERMAASAPQGYSLATDVAEWLVKQGVPFRDAHEITGRAGRRGGGPRRRARRARRRRAAAGVRVADAGGAVGAHGDGLGREPHGVSGTAPTACASQLAALTEQVRAARAASAVSRRRGPAGRRSAVRPHRQVREGRGVNPWVMRAVVTLAARSW